MKLISTFPLPTELVHTVNISGPSNPLSSGGKYSVTCNVTSDLSTSVWWLGPDNQEVDGTDPSVNMIGPYTKNGTTTLVLLFDPIKTSHGGTYSCKSSVNELVSQETTTINVEVQSKKRSGGERYVWLIGTLLHNSFMRYVLLSLYMQQLLI